MEDFLWTASSLLEAFSVASMSSSYQDEDNAMLLQITSNDLKIPRRQRGGGRTSCCWSIPPSDWGWTLRRRGPRWPAGQHWGTSAASRWTPGGRGSCRSPAASGPCTGGGRAPCRCPAGSTGCCTWSTSWSCWRWSGRSPAGRGGGSTPCGWWESSPRWSVLPPVSWWCGCRRTCPACLSSSACSALFCWRSGGSCVSPAQWREDITSVNTIHYMYSPPLPSTPLHSTHLKISKIGKCRILWQRSVDGKLDLLGIHTETVANINSDLQSYAWN